MAKGSVGHKIQRIESSAFQTGEGLVVFTASRWHAVMKILPFRHGNDYSLAIAPIFREVLSSARLELRGGARSFLRMWGCFLQIIYVEKNALL